MDNMIPIIVTGGGAPGIAGTISALRNNPDGTAFNIIATDVNKNVVGKYLADKFYQVPPPEDSGYFSALRDIITKEHIKAILPQTTREIMPLSKNTDKFAELGCAVVVSPYSAISISNDKYLLVEKAQKAGIPCPRFVLTDSETSLRSAAQSLGYPKEKIVVKPRISNGMRGLRILSENPIDVNEFLSRKPEGIEIDLENLIQILRRGTRPEMLVTEYLPGVEYTIDAFSGSQGHVIIPRVREKIRSGITFETRIDIREDLVEYSSKLADMLGLKYCFGFQFKLSSEGIPKLLECNPRVQGTMAVSTYAGFNMIYYSVMEALGKPAEVASVTLKKNIRFKRYWGGVFIDENGLISKI